MLIVMIFLSFYRAEERLIVSQFVEETRKHGDAAHICRSIAMLGILLGQVCEWELALQSQEGLQSTYNDPTNIGDISARIIAFYRSDRGAQNFPLAVQVITFFSNYHMIGMNFRIKDCISVA